MKLAFLFISILGLSGSGFSADGSYVCTYQFGHTKGNVYKKVFNYDPSKYSFQKFQIENRVLTVIFSTPNLVENNVLVTFMETANGANSILMSSTSSIEMPLKLQWQSDSTNTFMTMYCRR